MRIDYYLGSTISEHDYAGEYEVEMLPRVGEHVIFADAEDPAHPYEVWRIEHHHAKDEANAPEIRVYIRF